MAIYDRPSSPSSINLYLQCAYAFYLKYIKGIKFESGDAAALGSSVHKVNEMFWPEYKKNPNIVEAMNASVNTYWDRKVGEEYIDAAHTCLNNFMTIIGENPTIVPLYTELRCENPVNNTVAIIDTVFSARIVDYKTGTQYTVKAKQPNVIQATMCSQNLKECFGLDIPKVEFWYLRFHKYQRVDVTSELIEEVAQTINEVREGIAIDKFPKNEKSCFYCDYSTICRAEKKALEKYNKKTEMKLCKQSLSHVQSQL